MPQYIKHSLIKENVVEARSYQKNLAKSVIKNGNSLIVAPTALGKTIVAVLVIADVLEKKKGKILFLAPTKPLVEQHAKTILNLMKVEESEIAIITGAIKPRDRRELMEKTIVCSTPQCVRNDLQKKRISLNNIALIIFDEAHRAVGDYAYVEIGRTFIKQNPAGLMIGMTASPGHEKRKIKEISDNLLIENIEIKSHEDLDVKPYVNPIELEWRTVSLPKEYAKPILLLKAYLKKILSELKRMGQVPTDNPNFFSRTRILEMQRRVSAKITKYGKRMPSLYGVASKIACVLMASHALLLIETQGAKALNDYMEKKLTESKQGKASKALKMFIRDDRVKNVFISSRELVAEKIIHSKLTELKKILKNQFEENPNSRIIVFNHFRDSVAFIEEQLKKEKGVKPARFVGQASKGKVKGMNQKEQAQLVEEFREGKYNVLVATSVAEEGLDIPSCDLVIFYEPVPSEIRYIQRRGRTGRVKKGKAIILMAKDTRDEAFYWTARKKEGKMKRILKKMQGKPENQKTLNEFR